MKTFLFLVLKSIISIVVCSTLLYLAQLKKVLDCDLFPHPSQRGSVHEKLNDWHANFKLDGKDKVLFFGSSVGLYGINTAELSRQGIHSFSFCSPSQPIENSFILIKRYISTHQPKAIVIDAYPDLWGRPVFSIESALDWATNSPISSLTELGLMWELTFRIFTSKPFVVSNSLAKSTLWLIGYDLQVDDMEDFSKSRYAGNGCSAIIEGPDSDDCCGENLSRDFSMSNRQIFDNIHEFCMTRGVRLIVHIPPTRCEYDFELTHFQGLDMIDGRLWEGSQNKSNYDCADHLLENSSVAYSLWLSNELRLSLK